MGCGWGVGVVVGGLSVGCRVAGGLSEMLSEGCQWVVDGVVGGLSVGCQWVVGGVVSGLSVGCQWVVGGVVSGLSVDCQWVVGGVSECCQKRVCRGGAQTCSDAQICCVFQCFWGGAQRCQLTVHRQPTDQPPTTR